MAMPVIGREGGITVKKELSERFGTDVIDPEKPFEMVIGGTRYEVSCHFDPEGSRSIWKK